MLAAHWNEDIDGVPRGQSVILLCEWTEMFGSWIRGEAVREREDDGGEWFWMNGKRVEPTHTPRAWMHMPKILETD